MSGNKSTNQETVADFDRTSTEKVFGLPDTKQQFGSTLKGYQSGIIGYKPKTAQLNFAAPFSGKFDPIVQQAKSTGIQDINNRTGAINRSLSDVLGVGGTGDNSAVLAGLQNMNKMKSLTAINGLTPGLLSQQRDFDIARAGITSNQNAQKLDQANQFNQGQLGKLGAQSNLFGTLAQLAQAGASRSTSESGSGTTNVDTSTKKGILSK